MSNVVDFEQYRNLKHLLETDADFRAFVEGILRELSQEPWYNKPNSPYTVTKFTFNGMDITDKS